jgi:AraC-like DNA-binding protein
MQSTLAEAGKGRLERSCERAGDRMRIGAAADGIERLEARFSSQAFAPHRHDSYAIGVTRSGVQSFRYRGALRHCLPGQCHVLHPDELHDGGAGTDEGFGYSILYIDPALIQRALPGRPLPFVADPVVEASALPDGLAACLNELDDEIDDLARTEIAVGAAEMLVAAERTVAKRPPPLRLASLWRVRDMIAENPAGRHSMHELERVADLDRWTLARQFRAAFGTSPSRFRTMRRLERARRLLQAGMALAEAALDAGFADQSHMSRQFKQAYGLTPAKWAAMVS